MTWTLINPTIFMLSVLKLITQMDYSYHTLRKTDHKIWMLKVRIVFGNIKYVKAYDL